MVWSSFCRPICTAHHAKKKKRRLACELTYISFVPIAPFKQSLLYCFSFKLFQYFTLETAMESFWIIHLDGSLCIQEIVYLRITWSRKVSKHLGYISGFFTLTSDEARTAVLILKYAKIVSVFERRFGSLFIIVEHAFLQKNWREFPAKCNRSQ